MNDLVLSESLFYEPESLELPASWVGHIPFAYWLTEKHKPTVFVELGTHSGNSYFAFCQAVKKIGLETKCYAIDSWGGDEHAGLYDGGEVFQKVKDHNDLNFSPFSTLKKMYFEEAVVDFDDGSIDLLHIDGLHTYDAVKNDFETWLPKMSSKGVIIFHDTVVQTPGFGVWKFWSELEKTEYPNCMFDHSNGLGVLAVGDKIPPDLKALFAGDSSYLKTVFESLGLRLIDKVVNFQITIEKYEELAQYRDKQYVELQNRLSAVEKNSNKQIEYRDLLVKELEEQVIEVCESAEEQVYARDELVREQRQLAEEQRQRASELESNLDSVRYLINKLFLAVKSRFRK
jgi:hypothetical protein